MDNIFTYIISIIISVLLIKWVVNYLGKKISDNIEANYVQHLMNSPGGDFFSDAQDYAELVEMGQDILWDNANVLVDDLLQVPDKNIIHLKDRTFPALITIHKTIMILAAAKRGLIPLRSNDEIFQEQSGDSQESSGPNS